MTNSKLEKKKIISELFKIRYFEEKLLESFTKGLITGTTHTCIGQEVNATGIISNLDKKDIVLSNHRCHGHFLSFIKDYEGLLYEILGSENGVCCGLGGSQHLCVKDRFYSNGILGGNIPQAVGIAYANKLKKNREIVCLYIGDGSFGEGILFESINIAIKNNLPILVVIEDNDISQSTITKTVQSGSIANKIRAFDGELSYLEYPDVFNLIDVSKQIISKVRNYQPQFLVIKSNRLAAHSKGDDTRSKSELESLINRDNLSKSCKGFNIKEINEIKNNAKEFINKIFLKCITNTNKLNNKKIINNYYKNLVNLNTKTYKVQTFNLSEFLKKNKIKTLAQYINKVFNDLCSEDSKIIFFGEDIMDPYGGAFKITKGLSSKFKNQIFNTPISESALVGVAGGIATKGYYPVIEIMFGDFLSLTFDQVLNNITKFYKMYFGQIKIPLIIRTPMGGRRGYGPTHSQSIEKHFFGIEDLTIYAINPFIDLKNLYKFCFYNQFLPTLIIENKIDYNFDMTKFTDEYYDSFLFKISKNASFNNIFSINDFDDQATIICYGGMLNHVFEAVKKIYIEFEFSVRIICLGKISPLILEEFDDLINNIGPIFTVEESTDSFGFGSEIASLLFQSDKYNKRQFFTLGSETSIIPSSPIIEKEVLLNSDDIFYKIKNLINET